MSYSGLLSRLMSRHFKWTRKLTTFGFQKSNLIAAFLIVFLSQLLVLVKDPSPLRENSECPLYGMAVSHRLFCDPLTKIGAALALILPGFPILMATIETRHGHYSVGLTRIYSSAVDLLAVSLSISMAWYLGGLIIWANVSELHAGPLPLHSRSYSELFATPPSSDWHKAAYAIGFLVFAIPTFNGVVFSRKTILHERFLRQVFIGGVAFVARTALMLHWPFYQRIPLQFRSAIDGILISVLALFTSLLVALARPRRIRRPHAAVLFPAMFLMLPFSTLLPILESVGDQRVYNFIMHQTGGEQLGLFFLGVLWQLGTCVVGLAAGLVFFGTMFSLR